jgi:predicted metal-dependent HD superfamily phosphohydrolase
MLITSEQNRSWAGGEFILLMIKDIFYSLAGRYSPDAALAERLWIEIENSYTAAKRHYHTLTHLSDLHQQLNGHEREIDDWDVILFSIFYHDIVYNVLKSNNEEKSAELADKRMRELGVPETKIQQTKNHIRATKVHARSADEDTNIFVGADLSILGANWLTYSQYADNVRKEYSIFPDIVYKSGRAKVLQGFLNRERIFTTEVFFALYEHQAKANIKRELDEIK